MVQTLTVSRSREGAWIEIASWTSQHVTLKVAPVRERGLKFLKSRPEKMPACVAPVRERGLKSCGQCLGCRLDKGRSREGAWIEIVANKLAAESYKSLP